MHFADNNEAPQDNTGKLRDPLYKIRKFVDRIVGNFRKAYNPATHLSVDEQMIGFKGRLSFKQYMPAKPTKWGVKAFVIAESESAYVLDWFAYTGKDNQEQQASTDKSKGAQVVQRLLKQIRGMKK